MSDTASTIARSLLAATMLPLAACRPADVTAAHDQLGRGGRPPIQLDLPITIDPESVALVFGAELRFDAVTFDPFTFDYSQLLRTAPQSTGLNVVFGPPPAAVLVTDTVRFTTDDASTVTAGTIATGLAVRSLTNNTSCAGDMSLTFRDSTGVTVATFPVVNVAPGGSLTDTIALNGDSFEGFVVADADAMVGACVPVGGEVVNTVLDFPPLNLASVQLTNVDEPFVEAYAPLASESRMQAMDTIVAASGQLTLTVQNRLTIPFAGTVTLSGMVRAGGPLFGALNVPAASGAGPGTATLTFDLSGAVIAPGQVVANVAGAVQAASATVTAAQIAQAITIDGAADLVIAEAIGPLDPADTPELVVDVDEAEIFTPDDVDFGDLDDLIRDAVVDSALAVLTVENASDVSVRLSNLVAGLTRLDAAGNPMRDAGGDFLFETDGAGVPLVLQVTDPGSSEFTVDRQTTKVLELSAAAVLDRFMHLLNDSVSVGFAASGTATAGDGQPARALETDEILVRFDLSIHRLIYQRRLARRAGDLP